MTKRIILLFIILSFVLTACKNEEPINKTMKEEDNGLIITVSAVEKENHLLFTTSFENTLQKNIPLIMGNQPMKILINDEQYPAVTKGVAFEKNLKNNETFKTETLTIPLDKEKEEAMIIVSYQEEGKEKEIHWKMNLQESK